MNYSIFMEKANNQVVLAGIGNNVPIPVPLAVVPQDGDLVEAIDSVIDALLHFRKQVVGSTEGTVPTKRDAIREAEFILALAKMKKQKDGDGDDDGTKQ